MLLLNPTISNVPQPGPMYNNGPPPPGQQPPNQWDDRNRPNQYPPQEYGQPDYRMGPPPMDPYPNQDPFGRGTPPQHATFNQPAPRQRTAIACRYCRRRKIRCSGFENAADGRCSNCTRFNQECIFTPVSSQAQAFVPAHAAYPHLRGGISQQGRGRGYPPVIYGAHGQPLGQVQLAPGASENFGQNYNMPDRASYNSHGSPYYDEGSEQARASQRGEPSREYGYGPDPNAHMAAPVSPSGSTGSYQSAYTQQPQYGQPSTGPQRSSPQSTYSYESQPSPAFHPAQGLHPPQVVPQGQSSHTPPPPSNGAQTQGGSGRGSGSMSIQNLLGDPSRPERNATDSNMLNALNRRGGM